MQAIRVLRARSARTSHALREKKTVFLASLPRSRSMFSATFQTFCLTARAYLNTQKYGLFCSLQFCKHRHSRDSWDTKLLFQTWSLQIAGNYRPETHRRPKLTLRGLTRARRYRATSDRRDVVYEIKY